ncbi:hypothetical protein MW332_003085 [Vibrio parahaemolyticus]|nr:hypothetical protein [Vibrio parahaemolyticus]
MSQIPTHHSEKKIYLINGRCGGNKTGYITAQIDQMLEGNPEQCIIYAAPTKKVLAEIYSKRLKTSSKEMVVSSDQPNATGPSTLSRVTGLLHDNFQGCLLITHMTLFRLEAELLRNKLVIIDESPEHVVQFENHTSSISEDGTTNSSNINKLLSFSDKIETKKENVSKLVISENYRHEAIKHIEKTIKRIQHLKQEQETSEEINNEEKIGFLNKALNLFNAAFTGSVFLTNDSTQLMLRSINYYPIISVIHNAKTLWIASADFEYNLLHYILTRLHNYPVERIEDTDIPIQHEKSKVTIYPVMNIDVEWSRTLYEKDQTKLNIPTPDTPEYQGKKTVFDECFNFATHLVKCEMYESAEHGEYRDGIPNNLLFVNIHKKTNISMDKFVHISTVSHGLNEYLDSHHAVWLAATVPTPDEIYALDWFGIENELDCDELKQALRHTRIYAQIYQGLARTSLRNDNDSDPSNVFIVPDKKSADELLKWIPKAKIDDSYSYSLKQIEDKKAKLEEEFGFAYTVFSELKKAKHGQKNDIYKKYNLTPKKAQRLKERHRDALIEYNIYIESNDDKINTMHKIDKIRESGKTIKEACQMIGMSESTYKRTKREYEMNS